MFLPLSLGSPAIDHTKYITLAISCDDVIHFNTSSKPPMEVDWLKVHLKIIAVNVHSVSAQTLRINSLPMHITS